MGVIRDRLNAMTVRVSSPDGNITGTFTGGREGAIWFRDDAYYRYEPDRLVSQLESVVKAWFVGYDKGRLAVRHEAGRPVGETAKPHWDKRVRDFREALSRIECEGLSESGRLRVISVNRRDVTVVIEDGALDDLSEEEFTMEFREAVADLISDIRMASEILKQEHIDGRPRPH